MPSLMASALIWIVWTFLKNRFCFVSIYMIENSFNGCWHPYRLCLTVFVQVTFPVINSRKLSSNLLRYHSFSRFISFVCRKCLRSYVFNSYCRFSINISVLSILITPLLIKNPCPEIISDIKLSIILIVNSVVVSEYWVP